MGNVEKTLKYEGCSAYDTIQFVWQEQFNTFFTKKQYIFLVFFNIYNYRKKIPRARKRTGSEI